MKNIIILILFSILISPVNASEIMGSISTNPNNLEPMAEISNLPVETRQASSLQGTLEMSHGAPAQDEDEVLVLGFSQYPDSSLLRGDDARIYLIKGKYKKHIKTLKELEKYSGQIIFHVSDKELSEYQTRVHLNGDLIREEGDAKIFNIVDGRLKHVLNLEELRANFAGQEIFNISQKEMLLYRDF